MDRNCCHHSYAEEREGDNGEAEQGRVSDRKEDEAMNDPAQSDLEEDN